LVCFLCSSIRFAQENLHCISKFRMKYQQKSD
jgi:hypothetical protein